MKRFAFTMLELIFVIVVIGILAILMIPNFNPDPLQQAAEQVARHIRYTQHLAMIDDKFNDKNATWQSGRWQIHFEDDSSDAGQKIYIIYNNKNHDTNENDDELAHDPLTGQLMRGANSKLMTAPFKYMDELMLSRKYGIENVIFSDSCHYAGASLTSNRILFDNLGRPYYYSVSSDTTPFNYKLQSNCNITLTHQDGNATITVAPETGYVSITYTNQ